MLIHFMTYDSMILYDIVGLFFQCLFIVCLHMSDMLFIHVS